MVNCHAGTFLEVLDAFRLFFKNKYTYEVSSIYSVIKYVNNNIRYYITQGRPVDPGSSVGTS